MKTDRKIFSYSRLVKVLQRVRENKRVVVVTGSWDIFHTGHLMFLDFAKRQGDILIVGVGSDQTIKDLKGPSRPIVPERLRIRLVAGLEVVDYAVLLNEKMQGKLDMLKLFELIRPEVWVIPYHDHDNNGNQKLAQDLNIKLIKNPRRRPNNVKFPLSSSYILKKISDI